MRRAQRLFVTCVIGLVVPGGVSFQAVAATAAGPVAPYDALTFYAGAGQKDAEPTPTAYKAGYVFDSSNSAVTARTFNGSLAVKAAHPTGGFSEVFAIPPAGGSFVAGTTYPTASVSDSSHARLSFTFPRANCIYGPGSLTVSEISRDADSVITSFAASWSAKCYGDSTVFRGEIRWHSTLGFAGVVTRVDSTTVVPVNSPSPFNGGPMYVASKPVTVTYSSRGSSATGVTTPTLVGPGAASFAITGSTCAGQRLAFGETCTVSVVARPVKIEAQRADLVLGSDLAGGEGIAIRLSVSGTRNVKGMYTAVTPDRLLDTRIGQGAARAPLGSGRTLRLKVAGVSGVPASGVGAVVLNLTGTAPTADTHLTAYRSFTARPATSSLNLRRGATTANMVTVQLSNDGSVDIYNAAGSTQVVADVIGYYASDPNYVIPALRPSTFHPVTARRLLDTRVGTGPRRPGYGWTEVKADFGPGVNASIVSVAVNITATEAQEPGYLIAWNGDQLGPNVSTVNFVRGVDASNMSLVQIRRSASGVPTFKIFNASGPVHLVVDVFGYYEVDDQAGGLQFLPTQPVRIVDTRSGRGTNALGVARTATVTAPAAVVGPGTRALVTNTTLVKPTRPTYLTLWPVGAGVRPGVSNVNAGTGQTVASAAVTSLGSGGRFNVYNNAGATDALVDVVGTFEDFSVPQG